jgi:hypothetical protein
VRKVALEDLTQLEILQGSTSLIYAISGTIIGLIIAAKYLKHNKKELLGIGLSLALITAPWYGGGISFLTIIFFDYIIDDSLYFFINYGLIAFALISWMYGISILIFPKWIKKNVIISIVICIPYEILFIIFLTINPSMIGTKQGKFNSDAAIIPTIFIIFGLLVTLITMLMFIRVCLRSDNLKIKWQGRFLLIAVILLIIGSFMDAMITVNPMILIITKTILMIRLFFSYLGWLMPKIVAKWLIKED